MGRGYAARAGEYNLKTFKILFIILFVFIYNGGMAMSNGEAGSAGAAGALLDLNRMERDYSQRDDSRFRDDMNRQSRTDTRDDSLRSTTTTSARSSGKLYRGKARPRRR